jgi:hypothetical protein
LFIPGQNLPVAEWMTIQLVDPDPIVLGNHGINVTVLIATKVILDTVIGNPEIHHQFGQVIGDRRIGNLGRHAVLFCKTKFVVF